MQMITDSQANLPIGHVRQTRVCGKGISMRSAHQVTLSFVCEDLIWRVFVDETNNHQSIPELWTCEVPSSKIWISRLSFDYVARADWDQVCAERYADFCLTYRSISRGDMCEIQFKFELSDNQLRTVLA